MSEKRIGIREIAARGGLGVSTVSMALRDDPKIAPATRTRVQELARQMGYRPNPAFSAVGSRHHRNPHTQNGLPLAYLYESSGSKPAYGRDLEFARIFADTAVRMGYHLQLLNVREFSSPETASRALFSRGFAGVFLGSYEDDKFFERMDCSRLAVVCVGRYFRAWPYTTVRFSRLQVTRLMMAKCRERGYRRVGLLRGFHRHGEPGPGLSASGDWDFEDFGRVAGYFAAVAEHPEMARLPLFRGAPRDLAAIRRWLEETRPDAVIGLTGLEYHTLTELGLRIPEDLALVNQVINADDSGPSITGIAPNLRELANAALETLDGLLRHSDIGPLTTPREVIIPAQWHEGVTLPNRRVAAAQ